MADDQKSGVTEEAAAGITSFLRYEARLFPFKADVSKAPHVKRYADIATTNLKLLQAWATKWPGCNWAVYTSSKFLVIDVDARHGGVETLNRLEQELGPLPRTPKVLTSGGGWHLYYMYCQWVPTATGLAPGIDVRSYGRQSSPSFRDRSTTPATSTAGQVD